MDYEKEYKAALGRARNLHKDAIDMEDSLRAKMAEIIFPELKESEDERIRKWLIDTIKAVPNDSIEWEKIDKSDILAWLEKQKDYIKHPNSAYTPNRDVIEFADKYSHSVWENLMDNFKKNENYSIGCNDVSDIVLNAIINTYNWLEKHEPVDAKVIVKEVKQGIALSPNRWYDVSLIPQEQYELLVEWDSEDATWHDVAFYHAETKTFQNYEHQIKGVTRWCYIKDLLGKQDKKEPVNEAKDYNGIDPHFEL